MLYTATALWAHGWMLDGYHPDAQLYPHRRGLSDATISRAVISVTLNDTESLVSYLRERAPMPFPMLKKQSSVCIPAPTAAVQVLLA